MSEPTREELVQSYNKSLAIIDAQRKDNSELSGERTRRIEVEGQLDRLRADNARLKAAFEERDKACSDLEYQISKVENERDQLKARVVELESENRTLNMLVKGLEGNLKACEDLLQSALKEAKAVMQRSGWHKCACPGHWKEHGPSCYIGQALATINKALEGK